MPHPRAVLFPPILFWILLQLAALALSAFRTPLSARFPAPEEELAPHLMLATQMTFSAMLFPLLFRNLSTGLFIVAIAPVFSLVAAAIGGLMANHGLEQSLIIVPFWLCGLLAWSLALTTDRARLFASAVLTFLVLGFALLAYLQREFGNPTQSFDWSRHAASGPLMAGLSILQRTSSSGTVWIFLGSFLASGLFAWGVGQIHLRRPTKTGIDPTPVPTTPHHPV